VRDGAARGFRVRRQGTVLPMKRLRHLLATVTVTVTAVGVLAACGGGSSDDRPSASDISDSLQHGKASGLVPSGTTVSDDAADCMGTALHDSALSDEALRAFVDGDTDYQGSKKDAEAISGLSSKMTDCVKK
jgi:hypothetical protein